MAHIRYSQWKWLHVLANLGRQSRVAENANAMLIKSSNMSIVVDGSNETSVNLFLTGLARA